MALKMKDSPLQHFSVENLYLAFNGLNPREKWVVLGGMAALIVLLLFLPMSLVSGKLLSMQREIAEARKGFQEVQKKIDEYQTSQREIQMIERSLGQAGSVTGRVEGAANKVGIPVKQLTEKPPQDTDFLEIRSVGLQLTGTSLKQLIDFLYEIEHDPDQMMRVRRIQAKPKYSNRQLLDVSCEIATFSMRKEG
ncbi:MAG: type II secretion system protein M [Deltaproteobacteria bacterium]|nr:type II secretion system protein M [Deltaproteobacteria bacterium]